MQLSINGKQVQVSEALNEHIERLVTAISEKYFGDPLDGSVTVSKEGNNFRTDIAVHVGREMFVRGQGIAADAYASVDQAGEHIDKRLRRFKRRVRDHHRGNGGAKVAAQQYVLAGELPASEPPVEDEWQPVVVRNRAHGEMNVIYRRSDGNIGWIDPKGLAQA